jgi:hypothetical protein
VKFGGLAFGGVALGVNLTLLVLAAVIAPWRKAAGARGSRFHLAAPG